MEPQRKYKNIFAKAVKSKFGNSVWVGLNSKISTFLPKITPN